ncbi:serine hydrolase [Flavobacterium sp.]|uniref:serine hydrolase n=1 Tax=Flavobacterium sp. TaxID=239 RepID=UPI00286C58BE|nr:serine hydrolase [Flavobacterium sp.]
MKIITLILLLPIVSWCQKNNFQEIEKYMDAQNQVNKFGGTVIVMKNDTVILKKAYGYADLEWNVKNTFDTKFVLASISKHFTAIAIMQLVEKKQLSFNDKLNKFFPNYPQGEKVTIHMLLTHTAGLPLDFEDLYLDSTIITKDSAIANIKNKPYLFNPGTNCKYSNIGYFLLSQIIEKASGQTYEVFLKQNIFDKAKMKDTGVCNNDSIIGKKAKIYYRNGNNYVHNPYINWNLNTGLDGIYSTIDDLYKLDRAFYGETLLSNLSKSIMTTQYNKIYPDNGFIDSYGYGIFINPYYNHNHYLLTHSGGFIGTMTTYDSYPKDNIFIAVLSNNESESHMISYGLAGILFGIPVELPYLHKEIFINKNTLSKFAGKYGNLEVINKDNKLYLNTEDNELLAESSTKFFSNNKNDRTFEFIIDKKGIVKSMILTKGGVKEIKIRKT